MAIKPWCSGIWSCSRSAGSTGAAVDADPVSGQLGVDRSQADIHPGLHRDGQLAAGAEQPQGDRVIAVSLQAGFEVPRFGDLHGMGRIVAHTQEDVVLSDARGSGCRIVPERRHDQALVLRQDQRGRASLHRRARESSRSSGSTRRTTATLSTVQTGWVVQSSRRNQTSRGLLADLEPGLAEAAAEPGLAVPELGLDPGLADLQVGLVGPHPVLAMGCPIVRIAVRSSRLPAPRPGRGRARTMLRADDSRRFSLCWGELTTRPLAGPNGRAHLDHQRGSMPV